MYRTEDNYELYFSNEVSEEGTARLKELWKKYQLDANYFISSLPTELKEGETDFSFILHSTYGEFKKPLLAIYEALGDYDGRIIFSGDADDLTMEVSATFADGAIEYSVESFKNHGEESISASFSGEKNFVYNGGIETDIDKFVESLTP